MSYAAVQSPLAGQPERRHPEGFTWVELRDRLNLPYDRACPTWVKRMETEIGLVRAKGAGRAYVWRVA